MTASPDQARPVGGADTGTSARTREELIGFAGDLRGNEGRLVAMDAIAQAADGSVVRYPATGGSQITVRESDLRFVREADLALIERWEPGDVIWFAGRRFVALASANSEMRALTSRWHVTNQGHRLRTGQPEDLRRLRNNLGKQLSTQLHRYLSDPLEKNLGAAEQVFDLYLAVEATASPRRSLTSALYFHERFDTDSFYFERERAVENGSFESAADFDREFRKLRVWLREDRLTSFEPGQSLVPNYATALALRALMPGGTQLLHWMEQVFRHQTLTVSTHASTLTPSTGLYDGLMGTVLPSDVTFVLPQLTRPEAELR